MKTHVVIFAILTSIALPVVAADKHDDAHAQYGGVAVEAGTYHVELVAKGKTLAFYVNGHDDKPVSVKDAKATANVFSGKDKAVLTLAASGANAMTADAPFAIAADAKVVVTFTLAGKKSEQARFSLGAKQEHKGHKH